MKFSLDLGAFAEALGVAAKATTTKNVRLMLANVLIQAENNELRLVGTDQEMMAIARIPAAVDKSGCITIPARLLTDIIASLTADSGDETIQFEMADQQSRDIIVTCGRFSAKLQVQDYIEFPPIPNLAGEDFPRFSMPAGKFAQAMKEAVIAAGNEETTAVQRCVALHCTEIGKITLVATDSKRLVVTALSNAEYPESFNGVHLVPTKAVAEIIRLLSFGETVSIGLFNKQLVFETAGYSFLTRLLDGKFPDFNRILPKQFVHRATIARHDMLQALRVVRPIAALGNHLMHIDLGVNDARIWAESQVEGMSEAYVSIALEGEPVNICFNDRFVADFLGVVEHDDIVLEMTSSAAPGLFKPGDTESPLIYLVMPITF